MKSLLDVEQKAAQDWFLKEQQNFFFSKMNPAVVLVFCLASLSRLWPGHLRAPSFLELRRQRSEFTVSGGWDVYSSYWEMWAMQRRSSSNMHRGRWNLWLHSKQCICRLKLPEVRQSILLEKNKYQRAEDWSRTRQSRWIFVFLPAKKKALSEKCRLCRNSKKANLILEECYSWPI